MESLDTGTTELLATVSDGVATLTLNRPQKRNALSDRLTPALRAMLPPLDARRDVRCIVITGAGNAFCAGGDVSQMGATPPAGTEERSFEEKVAELRERQRTLTLRLVELATPTIAALPGPAAGAGMSIALACDLRIAARSAFLTAGFGRIGLSGDYGGSWLLNRLVGPAVAKDLYFTGRRVAADEALKLGLFNRVVEDNALAAAAADYAAAIAGGAPVALRYMKAHIERAAHASLGECLDVEAEHLLRCVQTADHREGVLAFVEKREPRFKGE